MDDSLIVEYIDKLLKSDIEKKDVLLMVYDFLRFKYGQPEVLDTLRNSSATKEPLVEYEVPEIDYAPVSIPAMVVSSYTDGLRKRQQ